VSPISFGVRRRLNRAALTGAAATLALAGLSAVSQPPAQALELLSESFKNGSTSPGAWIAPSPRGDHTPCLTAAATRPPDGSLTWCNAVRDGKAKADPAGEGAFQLTDNSNQDAGGVILNRPIKAGAGLHVEFDQFQYNTSTAKGADGLSFFLVDGKTAAPNIGDSGGWLGYHNLKGAFVGVGFDQYGNFSNPELWGAKDKGPGLKPNTVVVRGSQSSGYQYVRGVAAPAPLAVDHVTTRDKARRSVSVDVSTQNVMSVYVDFHDGKGRQKLIDQLNLDAIPGQAKLPDTVMLGFAASTGKSTNYHELQNFKVTTLDPDLNVKVAPAGPFKRGGTGEFDVTVANGPVAGPTTGPVSTTFTVPEGLTYKSASGDGWTCQASGPKVTCTRPGTEGDVLKPGAAYPPVKVLVDVPTGAPEKVTAQAIAGTPLEHKPEDNTSPPVTVTIEGTATAPIPDLSVRTTPDGPFKAGGTGTSTTVVTNAPGAGPATGATTVTIPAPPGTTITASKGDGWTCTVAGDAKLATCTRPDKLEPGRSFPPITTTYSVPAGTAGQLEMSGSTVKTPGDSDPGNDTSPTATVQVDGGTQAEGVDDVICRGGQFNVQIDPGLTFFNGTVRLTASGDLGLCQSDAHPRLTGGTVRAEAVLQGKCPGPVGPGYARVTIAWNDGTRSTITQSSFRADAVSWLFEGGRVAEGAFKGTTAHANGRTISNLIELGAGCGIGGLKEYRASIDELAIQ